MLDYKKVFNTLTEFASSLLTPYDVDLALEDLALRLRDLLEIDGAGVSLAKDGELYLATAIPDDMRVLEEVQVSTQSGPCVDAFKTEKAVVIADLQSNQFKDRWPKYCAKARELSVSSIAAIPMGVADNAVGAVNLYSRKQRSWSDEEITLARAFADAATVYLLNSATYDNQRTLNRHLQNALESRILIEQAKGIIAEARGIDVETAFELIRKQARSRSAPLRSVAEAIVRLGLRL